MRRLPPTGALEAFLAAARGGTLTEAARDLNLSVSALSRRVQSLEAHTGRSLFERQHHQLKLTAAGAQLRDSIEGPYDALVRALEELYGDKDLSISVGVPPSFAGAWLMPRMHRFRERHPDVDIRFDSSGSPTAKLGISLDAIILFAATDDTRLDMRVLKPQAAFAVTAPGLLPPEGTLEERIAGRPLLIHSGLEHILPTWLADMGLEKTPGSRLDTYDNGPVMVSAAEAGLGVALVLEDMVAFYPGQTPRLERPFGERVMTPYSYCLATKPAYGSRRALGWFRDWLLEEAAAEGAIAAPEIAG